jgi:SAM-dependent methyltransferase
MSATGSWEELHRVERFRPRYPSEPVVRFLVRRLGERRGRVLDLGCGAGRHTLLARQLGHDAVGSDLSITGLRHVESPRVGSAMQALPFATGSFDAVIAFGVLYYNDAAGVRDTVAEMLRVLRPGGWALVVTRTPRDGRFGRGEEVEPMTWRATDDETSERGMLLHFLDRATIDSLFAAFSEVTVDVWEWTAGGGRFRNSDWVIEARKQG